MTALKSLLAASAIATAMLATGAQATVLVHDNFESYSPTQHGADFYDLNFSAFTSGLHVEGGYVDLIGTPNAWSLSGASNYVDLDGSMNDGGMLRTDVFSFNAGDVVTLSFDLAGNQRGGTDVWDFGFQTAGGDIQFNDIMRSGYPTALNPGPSADGPAIGAGDSALPSDSLWHHYTMSFTAGNSGTFTAYVATDSADNVGPLVDNFRLAVNGVPEPGTWALMLIGFGGLGAALRRRRAAGAALA